MRNSVLIVSFLLALFSNPATSGEFYGGGGGGSTISESVAYASCSGSVAGDICIPEDSPLTRVYDGSTFLDYLPGSGPPVAAMPTAGWTQVGTAPTSLTAVGGTRVIVPGAGIGGYSRAAPSTSWRARTLVTVVGPDSTPDLATGLYLQETATNESLGIQLNQNNLTPIVYIVDRPNGSTSQVGEAIVSSTSPASEHFHFRVWLEAAYDAANTGSELTFSTSTDGVNFTTHATLNVATYFTSAPDLTILNFDASGANTRTKYTQFLYYETPL